MDKILHNEAVILPMFVIFAALASSFVKILQKAYFDRKELVFTAKKYEYLYTAISFALAGGLTFAYEYIYLHLGIWAALIKAGTAALTVSGVYIIIIQVGRKGIKWLIGIIKKYSGKLIAAIKGKDGTATLSVLGEIANEAKADREADAEPVAVVESPEIIKKTEAAINSVVALTGTPRAVVQKIIAQLKK